MNEADTIFRLRPLQDLPLGLATSKYVSEDTSDSYSKPVDERDDYSTMNDDPIFVQFSDTDEYVPLDELKSRLIPNTPVTTRSEVAGWDLEHGFYNRDGNKAGDSCHDQSDLETFEQRLSREQEERLVALGVTGTAKPVPRPSITATGS